MVDGGGSSPTTPPTPPPLSILFFLLSPLLPFLSVRRAKVNEYARTDCKGWSARDTEQDAGHGRGPPLFSSSSSFYFPPPPFFPFPLSRRRAADKSERVSGRGAASTAPDGPQCTATARPSSRPYLPSLASPSPPSSPFFFSIRTITSKDVVKRRREDDGHSALAVLVIWSRRRISFFGSPLLPSPFLSFPFFFFL